MEESAVTNESPVPLFFSRELSWVDFNERVLGEGLRRELPPLERMKFLSIVASNFDEFFMVRVAALKLARQEGTDPSGLSTTELLEKISKKVRSINSRQFEAFMNEVIPDLAKGGFMLKRPSEWSPSQREYLESLFAKEIYPILTPLRIEETGPLPFIDNFALYAAFLLESESSFPELFSGEERVSIIRIPQTPDRVIWLPLETSASDESSGGTPAGRTPQAYWTLIEDLIQSWGTYVFPGYKVKESLVFKVNRDADFSVDEKRDEDFVEAMAEVLEGRGSSMPVRMVYTAGSEKLKEFLARRFSLGEDDLYEISAPLNLQEITDLLLARGMDQLKEKTWKIYSHPSFSEDQNIWDRISQEDVLLHVPYQSFDPVIRFFQEAAKDPQVTAIKTALYRTSGDSPVVRALEQASLSGKHVTAVVELKARFDEGRNISWARRLEKAGVIVVYGLAKLKVHAKVTIVMRREYDRVKRYVHLSTGNYNDKTAKLYEDFSIFSSREDLAYDAGLLFNMITGYSAVQSMTRLVAAPTAMKRRLLELITREINRSSPEMPGRIMAKMNALADPDIIKALYRASQAGVKIMLNVRGVCMLVPGVQGLSENIRVVSVIDHFLEHSRICYFANGGADEIYLGSADWMTRNLERRVELMFPVLQEDLRKTVYNSLMAYFSDNSQAWLLNPDGAWTRIEPSPGEKPFRVQAFFHSAAAKAHTNEHPGQTRGEFIVRRSSRHQTGSGKN